jgi:hypothetical protein
MSVGLELTARALERDEEESNERALNSLRDLRAGLVELTRLRHASNRVVRHSLIWRSRIRSVVREKESADHLDLLGGSCLVLARAAIAVEPPERQTLAPSVRELAGVLGELAKELDDRQTRQRAADRALDIARQFVGNDAPSESALAAALISLRMVAADIMVFAGVAPGQAADVLREGGGELRVPSPPRTRRIPFISTRQRPRR